MGGRHLQSVIEEVKPDLLVVFLMQYFAFASRQMRGTPLPLVLCQRNDPAAKAEEWKGK